MTISMSLKTICLNYKFLYLTLTLSFLLLFLCGCEEESSINLQNKDLKQDINNTEQSNIIDEKQQLTDKGAASHFFKKSNSTDNEIEKIIGVDENMTLSNGNNASHSRMDLEIQKIQIAVSIAVWSKNKDDIKLAENYIHNFLINYDVSQEVAISNLVLKENIGDVNSIGDALLLLIELQLKNGDVEKANKQLVSVYENIRETKGIASAREFLNNLLDKFSWKEQPGPRLLAIRLFNDLPGHARHKSSRLIKEIQKAKKSNVEQFIIDDLSRQNIKILISAKLSDESQTFIINYLNNKEQLDDNDVFLVKSYLNSFYGKMKKEDLYKLKSSLTWLSEFLSRLESENKSAIILFENESVNQNK